MPTEGLSMRQVKEILRMKYSLGMSVRQIARRLGLSIGVVCKYLRRAEAKGWSWPLTAEVDESVGLEDLGPARAGGDTHGVPLPDFAQVHQELKRKGVTRQLLWQEYRERYAGEGLSYTHFCLLYRQWRARLKRRLRQTHVAGEKVFVDYCGPTVPVIDRQTGELWQAQIFVAVLGASNYTFAEATRSQTSADWISSHERMLRYFGGVPVLLVPDNLKSAVTQPCRYEPQVQSTYAQFAAFYGCAVLPARPYKPRDKAKVEVAVLIVERWILARLRHQTFFSLVELNRAIGAWLVVLNDKPFKKLPGTRRSQFEQWDRPALKPLSTERFEFSEWKTARVHIDYHVEIEGHYYSVPHALVGQRVQVRVTAATVECFSDTTRVAAHARSMRRGAHTTLAEHMPKAHRKHMQWTPGRLLNWGADIGPSTGTLVKHLLENKPHPEHGYRACLGLLNLVKRYDATRVEAACARALHIGSPTRRSVVSILERGLDRQTLTLADEADTPPLPDHDNVRGPDYYQ